MSYEISPKSSSFISLNDEVKNLTQSKHWGGILFVKKDGSLGELNFFKGVLEILKGKLGFGENRTKDVKEVFSNLILKHIEELEDLDQKSDQELVGKIIDLAKKADLIQSNHKNKPDMLLNEVVREAFKNGDEKLKIKIEEELENRSFYKTTYPPAADHPFKLSNPLTKEKQKNDEDVDQSPGKNHQTSHEESEKPPSKDQNPPKQPIFEAKEKSPIPDLPKLEANPTPIIKKEAKPPVASESPQQKPLKQEPPLKIKSIEPLDVKLDNQNQWSSLKSIAMVGLGTVFSLGLAYLFKQPAGSTPSLTNENNESFVENNESFVQPIIHSEIIDSEIAQNVSNFYNEPYEAPTHWNYLDITKIKPDLPISNSLPPLNSTIKTEQCLLTDAPPSVPDITPFQPAVEIKNHVVDNENITDQTIDADVPVNVLDEESILKENSEMLPTDDANVTNQTIDSDVPPNVLGEEQPQKDLFEDEESILVSDTESILEKDLSSDEEKIVFFRSEDPEGSTIQPEGSTTQNNAITSQESVPPTPQFSIPSTVFSSSSQNSSTASFINNYILPIFGALGFVALGTATAKYMMNTDPDNASSLYPAAVSNVMKSLSPAAPAIIKTDIYVDVNIPDAFVLGKLGKNVETPSPVESAKPESPQSNINFNSGNKSYNPDDFYYEKIPYLLEKSSSQLTLRDGSPIPCQPGDLFIPFIIKTKISDLSDKETGFRSVENGTQIFLPLLFLLRNNHVPLYGSDTTKSGINQTIFLKYGEQELKFSLKDFDPFYKGTNLSNSNSDLILNMEIRQYKHEGKAAPSAPLPFTEFDSVKPDYLAPTLIVKNERELKLRGAYLEKIQMHLENDSNPEEFFYEGQNSIDDTQENLRDYLKGLNITDIKIQDLNIENSPGNWLKLLPSAAFATKIHLCVTDNSLIMIEKFEDPNYFYNPIDGQRVRMNPEAKVIFSNLPKAKITFIPLKENGINANAIKSFLETNITLESLEKIPFNPATPTQENITTGLPDKPSLQQTLKTKGKQPLQTTPPKKTRDRKTSPSVPRTPSSVSGTLSSVLPNSPTQASSNESIQAASNVPSAEKFKEAERKHFEASLTEFFEIFRNSDVKKSEAFIKSFKTETALPKDLWLFSKNLDSAIPYQDLECVKLYGIKGLKPDGSEMAGPPVIGYSVNKQQLNEFKERIGLSLESLDSLLLENTQLFFEHPPLSEVYNKLIRTFNDLKNSAKTYLTDASSSDDETITLSQENYDILKLPNTLREELFKALMQIEKPQLLKFYAHLAVITLNGGNDKSITVTQGLDKWRQYILERDPRSTNLQKGSPGISGKVYVDLLKSFFPIKAISDIDNYISYIDKDKKKFVKIGFIKGEADENKKDGYTGHYTCDLQTDKGLYNLDSIGSNKTPLNTKGKLVKFNYENVLIPRSLYDSKPKISLENLSVPRQNNNNCFLSAAWLQFCAFLHYYNASLETNSIETDGNARIAGSNTPALPWKTT